MDVVDVVCVDCYLYWWCDCCYGDVDFGCVFWIMCGCVFCCVGCFVCVVVGFGWVCGVCCLMWLGLVYVDSGF